MLQFRFYKFHIKGTQYHQQITPERDFLCNVKPSLKNLLLSHSACADCRVYLSTKSLKHIYDRHIFDKKNPQEFLNILKNLTKIIRYPDEVRQNKTSKRGDFLFVKKVNGQLYFVSLEIGLAGCIDLVSSSVTGTKYTKKFTLLWSWGTANPPS